MECYLIGIERSVPLKLQIKLQRNSASEVSNMYLMTLIRLFFFFFFLLLCSYITLGATASLHLGGCLTRRPSSVTSQSPVFVILFYRSRTFTNKLLLLRQ